jgi:hypothetical protein
MLQHDTSHLHINLVLIYTMFCDASTGCTLFIKNHIFEKLTISWRHCGFIIILLKGHLVWRVSVGYTNIYYGTITLLRIQFPDPGYGAFLTRGSGMEKIQSQDPGSGMNIPDLILRTLYRFFGLKLLKSFKADPGSCQPWIRDGKNLKDPG